MRLHGRATRSPALFGHGQQQKAAECMGAARELEFNLLQRGSTCLRLQKQRGSTCFKEITQPCSQSRRASRLPLSAALRRHKPLRRAVASRAAAPSRRDTHDTADLRAQVQLPRRSVYAPLTAAAAPDSSPPKNAQAANAMTAAPADTSRPMMSAGLRSGVTAPMVFSR